MILEILQSVADGSMAVSDAELLIKTRPFADLGYAKQDFHKGLRQGVPEVIYGQGKTAQQIVGIAKSLLENGQETVLITRLDQEKAEEIEKVLPLSYHDTGRIGIIGEMPSERKGNILVATGGTSDMPVAEEAALTAEILGNNVIRL